MYYGKPCADHAAAVRLSAGLSAANVPRPAPCRHHRKRKPCAGAPVHHRAASPAACAVTIGSAAVPPVPVRSSGKPCAHTGTLYAARVPSSASRVPVPSPSSGKPCADHAAAVRLSAGLSAANAPRRAQRQAVRPSDRAEAASRHAPRPAPPSRRSLSPVSRSVSREGSVPVRHRKSCHLVPLGLSEASSPTPPASGHAAAVRLSAANAPHPAPVQ